MTSDVTIVDNDCVMTVYDVVQVINEERLRIGKSVIQHSKALKNVEELATHRDFGQVAKIDFSVPKHQGMQIITTYCLTKKQAVILGGDLDKKRLICIVDRLEELERGKDKLPELPQTYADALRAYADEVENKERLALALKQSGAKLLETKEVLIEVEEKLDEVERLQQYLDVMEKDDHVWNMREFAAEIIGKDPRITNKIGGTRLLEVLRELGYIQKQTINKTLPYRHHIPHYFLVLKDDKGYSYSAITATGIKHILPEIVDYLT